MYQDKNEELRITVDQLERLLMFDYDAETQGALFDILDEEGQIVKTGGIEGPVTKVRLTELLGEEYTLMVIDGDRSAVRPIHLRKAS